MNISDELERILGEMDEDERKKAEESNTAKQMALLAEGGTAKSLPTGTHDMIHELRASMYGADPTNTHMPQKPDLATQFMQFLAQMYMPGLVAPQANVPTAAQGSYADVPSHASGGSIGYHQPGSLEQNMMALGGDKAIPIIMALHKASGGAVDNPSTLGSMGNVDVQAQLLTPEQSAAMDKQLADQIPTAQPFIHAPPQSKPESLTSQYDFLTQYGKNMIPNSPFMQLTEMARKPLQELMARLGEASDAAKIPPVMPELAAFEAAMGPGAQAAMRKSDEALKAITPKHGEFGSNLGNLSYQGGHTAPGPDFGAPLHDLTGGGEMYPADVYGPNAVQYYGTGFPKLDKEVFDLAKRVKGNPDAEVTVYRAVPNNENITDINKGDWVTLSKDYAKNHGESVLHNDYKILSKKAKAKDLYTNADSIHEFGYQPGELTAKERYAISVEQNIHPDYIKRAREEINGDGMDDDEYYKALNERANQYRIEDALEKYGYKTHGSSNVSSSSYHQKRIENKLDPDMNDDIHQVRISDHVDRHPPLEDEISKHFNINYRSDPANWADISIWPNMTDEEMHSRLSGLLE